MKSIKRKLTAGALIFGFVCAGMTAVSVINDRSRMGAVQASLIGSERTYPVIILDAGQGEST